MWSRKSADCTGEFPIPTAQASYQNQRQQKSQAQAGAEQGIFRSTQSPGQGIRRDTHAEAGYGQPIGDTSRPPVRPTRDRGKQGSQDPHSIFHHACGKYRSVVIIKTKLPVQFKRQAPKTDSGRILTQSAGQVNE